MTVSILNEDRVSKPFSVLHHDISPPEEPKSVGLRELFAAARRHLPLIVAITLAGTLLALVASFEIEKVYTARSMILLKPDDPNLLETAPQPQTPQPNASRMDTETDLMTSRVFAGRVVDELNLIADPNFNTFLTPAEDAKAEDAESALSIERFLPAGLSPIVDRLGALFPAMMNSDEVPLPSSAVQRDRAISVLLSKLSTARSGESFAMTVAASDTDPTMAATLANAVTRLYAEWSSDLKRESIKDAVVFLQQQAGEIGSRIAELENEIADYGRQEQVSSDPRDDLLRATMQQANEQLGTARGELSQAQSRLEEVRGWEGGATSDISPLLTSDFLTRLRGEEAAGLKDRAQIARNFGANHPLIKEADAKVASTRRMIAEEMQRIVANLENDVRVAEGRVRKLERDLAQSQQVLRRRAKAEIHLRELNRDLLREQQLYDLVSARLGKLDPYAEIIKPNARVVSAAAVPIEPSFPKTHTLVAGGFAGSLLLAFIAVVALEAIDTRVRDGRRISHLLRAPVLASIPRLPRRLWGRAHNILKYMRRNPRSAVAEGFRSLYGACRRAHAGQQGQVILVSSGLPREGKTTTAAGLAVAAASDGARTVLVDLDLRTGGLGRTRWFGSDFHKLEDYLRGECSLGDVLQPVPSVPMLSVVTSSASARHAPGTLGAASLEPLVSALRSEYEVVVIDSPPLLVVDDALAIAPFVDSSVIVTAWECTTEEALYETRERLRVNGIPLVGVVLNRVDPKSEGKAAFCRTRAHRKQLRRYFSKNC